MKRTGSASEAAKRPGCHERRDAGQGAGSEAPHRGPVAALHGAAGNQAVQSQASATGVETRSSQDSPGGRERSTETDGSATTTSGERDDTATSATVRRKGRRDDVAVVDVRSPAAFRAGHVPGATNVPVSRIGRRTDRFRNASEVIAYCRSGRRSRRATSVLQDSLGEGTRVSEFTGGMRAWRFRTETGGQSSRRAYGDTCSACEESNGDEADLLVQRLVETSVAQPSLTVSQPSDPAEREAERVAEAVVRSAKAGRGLIDPVDTAQETCPQCDRTRSATRTDDCPQCGTGPQRRIRHTGGPFRATDSQVTDDVAARVRSVSTGGRRLPGSVRTFFETRFDRDFGDVRVHTGPRTDHVARQLRATAFTVGTDVVFRSGAYRPFSREGTRLLAHELTHVVQQDGADSHVQRQGGPLSSWPNWVDFSAQTAQGVEDMDPPGDCPPFQHEWLQSRVNKWCKSPFGEDVNLDASCSGSDSCSVLVAKAQASYNCWYFRNRINTVCFRGGDAGHRRGAAEAIKRMSNCIEEWHKRCRNRHGDPESEWEWEDVLEPAAWTATAAAVAKAGADAASATWQALGQAGNAVRGFATMPIIVLPGTRQALEQQMRGPRKYQ